MRQKKDGQPKPTRRGCRARKHIQKRVQLLGDRITDLIEKEKMQPDKICYAAFTAIVNQINHNDSEQAIFKRLQNETKENSSSCCPLKARIIFMLAAQLDIINGRSPFDNVFQAEKFFSNPEDKATLFSHVLPHCTGSQQDSLIGCIDEIKMAM